MKVQFKVFVACVLLILGFSSAVHFAGAQGIVTGTIFGTAVDPAGAAIPGANVTATNQETGASYKTVTQANGLFSLRNLAIGHYQIAIDSSGFGSLKMPIIDVRAGDNINAGEQKLNVGQVAQSVTVSAESQQLLTTTSAETMESLNTKQLQDLPFNGNFDNTALTLPGVARTHNDSFSNSNGSGLAVNGQRGRAINFEIDGQSNNDNSIGGPQIFLNNPDALQEIQTITNNFSAQYGRNMGAVVNYVTKSGTNQFHGTAFEYYTGSFLSSLANQQKNPAQGFCAPGQNPSTGCQPVFVPRTVDNRWGGTLGGPILPNKLWFFGETFFEHTRDGVSPATSGSNTTPTPAGLKELEAAFPNNPAVTALASAGPYSIPAGNPQPVQNGLVTKTVSDGVTTAAIQFAPVERLIPALFNNQEDMGRIDFQPNETDHFFIRYIYQNQLYTGNLANGSSSIADGGFIDILDTAHSVGGDWTHTFSPQWSNQLRYSFQQTKLYFQGGAVPSCTGNDLTSCPSSFSFGSNLAGFGYATNLPQGRTVKVNQVQDNANFTHGSQSIAFGGEFDYQNSPNVFLPEYNGGFNFGTFDQFLQDSGKLNLGDGNPVIPFKEHDLAFYFQDDWRITPALILNLGVRYEYFSQAADLLHQETVARETGPHPFWDTSLPLSQRTFPYINQYYKNIEPRAGFAYNPQNFLAGRMVVRGGYSINVDPIFYNIFLNSATAAPVINLGTLQCSPGKPCLSANGATGGDVRALNLPRLPAGGNPQARNVTTLPTNFREPYTQIYTLGVQFQVNTNVALEVRYVGDHTARNFQSLNENPYLLPVATDFPNIVSPSSLCGTATDPGYGRLSCANANERLRANTAFSIYNGLQMALRLANYKGLSGSLAYTRSRTIDNVSEIFSTGSGGTTIAFAQNPLHTNVAERGVSGIDYPNLASADLTYAIPDYHGGKGLIGRALSGISVNALWSYNSGTPNNPYEYLFSSIGDTSYDDLNFDAAFIGANTERPVLSNKAAPLGTVGIYVSPAEAAATTTSGTPGYYVYNAFDANGLLNRPTTASQVHWLWNNQALAKLLGNPYPGVSRNINRGQAFNNVDANFYKTTRIAGRLNFQLQMTAFNVLNHQYIGTPDTFIEDYSPTGVNSFEHGAFLSSNNRTIQFAGKLIF